MKVVIKQCMSYPYLFIVSLATERLVFENVRLEWMHRPGWFFDIGINN